MCFRVKKVVMLGALTIVGCTQMDEGQLFTFPVEKLADVSYADTLKSSLLLEDADLSEFIIVDSSVVSYRMMGNDFMSITSLNPGDTLSLHLCHKGRGPGEFAVMTPSFDYYDGHLSLVDASYRKYYRLDFQKSLDSLKTMIDKEVQLAGNSHAIWPVISAFETGEERLLVHSSENLGGRPVFTLMDLRSGERVNEYDCFSPIPTERLKRLAWNSRTLLYSFDCINADRNMLFSAMVRIPQINILDLRSGSMKGFRLKGRPRLNRKQAYLHFMSVSAYHDRIYALYSGDKEIDNQMPTSPSSLYVFDWEGNIHAKYLLDGAYQRCFVTDTGIYLSKWDENDKTGLYRVVLPSVEE